MEGLSGDYSKKCWPARGCYREEDFDGNQSEMLLPIPGKKGREVVTEPVAKSSVRRKRAG
jgi:hypothetical protein